MVNFLKYLTQLTNFLAHDKAVLVKVTRTSGSVPRDSGSWMAVFPQCLVGTIGGGHLEFQAVALAKDILAGARRLARAANSAAGSGVGAMLWRGGGVGIQCGG